MWPLLPSMTPAAIATSSRPAPRLVRRASSLPTAASGRASSATTDGTVLVVDRHSDGRLRLVWADGATSVRAGGRGGGRGADGAVVGVGCSGEVTADVVAVPAAEVPRPAEPSVVTVRTWASRRGVWTGPVGSTVRPGERVELRAHATAPPPCGRPATGRVPPPTPATTGGSRRAARSSSTAGPAAIPTATGSPRELGAGLGPGRQRLAARQGRHVAALPGRRPGRPLPGEADGHRPPRPRQHRGGGGRDRRRSGCR